MRRRVEITRRVFLKIVTMTVLTIALVVILPFGGEAQNNSRIYGKAALIMKSGDIKPASRRTFVVLPAGSRLTLLSREAERKAEKDSGPMDTSSAPGPPDCPKIPIEPYSEKVAKQDAEERACWVEYFRKVDEWYIGQMGWFDQFYYHYKKRFMEGYQKAKGLGVEFKTDVDGSYKVLVSPGQWYICNQPVEEAFETYHLRATRIGNTAITWEVRVTVKAGQELKLDLANGNALEIRPWDKRKRLRISTPGNLHFH